VKGGEEKHSLTRLTHPFVSWILKKKKTSSMPSTQTPRSRYLLFFAVNTAASVCDPRELFLAVGVGVVCSMVVIFVVVP